jgi:ABC-type lipoprotein export system ATPase subunit
MREVLVHAEMLCRRYPGSGTVLVDASFEIDQGETVALTGASGSGKTTLLQLIAGLDRPSSGSIEWPALGTHLRPGPIGLAFQGPSLLPPLTVLENVALAAILAGATEDDANDTGRELLARFGVEDVGDRLPEEISGGQSQRGGLARALAGGPRLVLADEPTGQLDADSGSKVLDALLGSVKDAGASLVIATHDPAIAERLGERWTLHAGRLETEDIACSA